MTASRRGLIRLGRFHGTLALPCSTAVGCRNSCRCASCVYILCFDNHVIVAEGRVSELCQSHPQLQRMNSTVISLNRLAFLTLSRIRACVVFRFPAMVTYQREGSILALIRVETGHRCFTTTGYRLWCDGQCLVSFKHFRKWCQGSFFSRS